MKKHEVKEALSREIEKWSLKSYEELSCMKEHWAYEESLGESKCQVEVQVLVRNDQFVQLSIGVDDGSFRYSVFPMSRSILIYRDGRVDK